MNTDKITIHDITRILNINSSLVSRVLHGGPQITKDTKEHLMLKAPKRLAHFYGPQFLEIYRNCCEGYKARFQKHQLESDEELVFASRIMGQEWVHNIMKFLVLSYQMDVIFLSNNVPAIMAIQHLKREGIKIPEIAIVGYSNEVISTVFDPSTTIFNRPKLKIKKRSKDLIISQIIIDSDPMYNERIVIKASLIERDPKLMFEENH